MLRRREFLTSALATTTASVFARPQANTAPADYSIDIAPHSLEVAPRRTIRAAAYNNQVPGPLLRFREGQPVTIDVTNHTDVPEVVHWHGLFLPSSIDGAMEEGTPMIPPDGHARYTFTPRPAGFRWFHTHTFAGHNFNRGQYTGQHGFLYIEPRNHPGRYDAEFFLALHDWRGQLLSSDDGSMHAFYDISTINGRTLGFNEPLRVKAGQRALFHILNSSPTEVHWLSASGHNFEVVALDGNPVPSPSTVPMLRLAPAERVSAIVQMNNPGIWVVGEVREHIQKAGLGIVLEYANQTGQPCWQQPESLTWDYTAFADAEPVPPAPTTPFTEIPMLFESKFRGHGGMERWSINGKSFPHTYETPLQEGHRYRLVMKNDSADDHPLHLHRHSFELCRSIDHAAIPGLRKDTVLVPAREQVAVEFIANDPGPTLFHCHQQDHMDMGFMMLFRYA